MVRDHTISVEEADRLLRVLEPSDVAGASRRARLLRIRISGRRGEHANVALPLALADLVLQLLPPRLHMTVDGRELDLTQVVAQIRDGDTRGTIVDVRDPHGDHIEIIAE
ncbi:MAG TPA: hypothetical protein VEP50_09405 [bacterium]|nr:hypothetical protein [bacterium]